MAVFPKNREEEQMLRENKYADIPSARRRKNKDMPVFSSFRRFRLNFIRSLKDFFKKIARSITGVFKPSSKVSFNNNEVIMKNKPEEVKEKFSHTELIKEKQTEISIPEDLQKRFISEKDANYKAQTPERIEDIVKEFETEIFGNDLENMKELSSVNDKIRILNFMPSLLISDKIIDFDNLCTAFEYITGFSVSYDEERDVFSFGDEKEGIIEMNSKGSISVPKEIEGEKNPIDLKVCDTKGITGIAYFLSENQNFVQFITRDSLMPNSALTPVKNFITENNIPKKDLNAVEVFESACRDNSVLKKAENIIFARVSDIKNMSPSNKIKHGFKEPKKIIPYMQNPFDYLKVVAKAKELCAENISPEDAFKFALCYITNDIKKELPYGFVSKEVEKTIDEHILRLRSNDIKPKDIEALVKSYAEKDDLHFARTAVASIDQQINRLTPPSKILSQNFLVDYSIDKIIYEFKKDMLAHSDQELINSYLSHDTSPFNVYLNTLTAKEFNEVLDGLPIGFKFRIKNIIEQTEATAIYERTENNKSIQREGIITDDLENGEEDEITDTEAEEVSDSDIITVNPDIDEEFSSLDYDR